MEYSCSLNVYLIILVLFCNTSIQDELQVVEVISGEAAELPCNVTSEKEGDKLNILAWYRNGSTTAIYSRDLRGGHPGGTGDGAQYEMIPEDELAYLRINHVKPSDAGRYHCIADFLASPAQKTYVNLEVIELPECLWVHENGTQVATATPTANKTRQLGPYYVGDIVRLSCVAFGGKPQPTLSWWSEGRLLESLMIPISGYRVRSDLVYHQLDREDFGRVFTCTAQNNNVTAPMVVNIRLNMLLAPELVKVYSSVEQSGGSVRVAAGDPLSLQCRVLGARPLPDPIWMIDQRQLFNLEQNVTRNPTQSLVTSEVQISVGRDQDEIQVSCCVPANTRSEPTHVCSDPLPVTVTYPPSLLIVVEDREVQNMTLSLLKGSTVRLICKYEANPPVFEMIWYHEDDVVSKGSKKMIDSELLLEAVSESDVGEYVCAAANSEGATTSQPLQLDVIYPPHCKEANTTTEYGLAEAESMNVSCEVRSRPAPARYRWVIVTDDVTTASPTDRAADIRYTDDNVLLYQRPLQKTMTIFCFGINNVSDPEGGLPNSPCVFLITDETVPRPPSDCEAVKKLTAEITVTCQKGHDGGLPQKFTLQVTELETDNVLTSVVNIEPHFIVQEPTLAEHYRLTIVATNEKGDSKLVEINKEDIVVESDGVEPVSTVRDITTLSLSLCGGVALIALVACGLSLMAHDRGSHDDLASRSPALHAYTDESNCDTLHDSDESDYNPLRTNSMKRSRRSSRASNIKRTSSFHSAHEPASQLRLEEPITRKFHCRVHSMQNISRNKDTVDTQCENLVMRLPQDSSYAIPKAMNTFYTIPRKVRCKTRDVSDITSESQNSDGLSLPPPPEEFTSYRPASRLSDVHKPPTLYSTIRKPLNVRDPSRYNNVVISPLNTVGLPTASDNSYNSYAQPNDTQQNNPFDSD